MAWKKIKDDHYHYQLKDKKGKLYSAYWYYIGKYSNKLSQNFGLWGVERGGWNASTGFKRTYTRKLFNTKAEAMAFIRKWKSEVVK